MPMALGVKYEYTYAQQLLGLKGGPEPVPALAKQCVFWLVPVLLVASLPGAGAATCATAAGQSKEACFIQHFAALAGTCAAGGEGEAAQVVDKLSINADTPQIVECVRDLTFTRMRSLNGVKLAMSSSTGNKPMTSSSCACIT